MDANSALQQATGQADNVGSLLQQEQTTLDPMQKNLAATSGKDVPQPKLEKAPDEPQADLGKDATSWMGVLNVLAGLGGARSRQGATAALTAFSGGMQGFKQGKLEDIQQHQAAWKDANESVIENNKAQIEAYKSALTDKKMSVDEQMANIKIIASQYHNDIMSQLAEQRNFTAVARVMDMMQSNTEKLQLAFEKLHDQVGNAVDQAKTAQDAAQDWIKQYIDPTTQKPIAGAPPLQKFVADAMKKDQAKGGGRSDAAREQDIEALHNGATPTSLGYSMRSKNNPDWIATKNAWAEKYPDDNPADSQIDFATRKAGSITNERAEVGIKRASNILDSSLPSMLSEAKKLGLGDSTDINSLITTYKSHMSDPTYANYRTQLRAIATDYANLIGRGNQTVHSDEEALKILSDNMGQSSLQGFADAVRTEQANLKSGMSKTDKEIKGGQSQSDGGSSANDPMGLFK